MDREQDVLMDWEKSTLTLLRSSTGIWYKDSSL